MERQNTTAAEVIVIDNETYPLVAGEEPLVTVVPTQPGEMEEEWERRIYNAARGWGESRYAGPGGYDYTVAMNMHRPLSFMNGPSGAELSLGTEPIDGSSIHFSEYWDGTEANRRLVITTARHIYEVDASGTVTVADLGANFTLARGMKKAVRYKNSAMASPKMYISRPSATSTDYMVERTGTGTYALSANNKRAFAIAVGKDPDGEDIIWRVDENGKLNASLADTDPSNSASWAAATYAAGEGSVRVNDLAQQAGALLVGRVDGVWTFDNVLNPIPITPAVGQVLDDYNCQWMKDFNGMALIPTASGLIWLDGLEWGMAGPVSTNNTARNIRALEVSASAIAGNYIYMAVYDVNAVEGGVSYIFMGEPREMRADGTGRGPLVWHGPFTQVSPGRITDLWVSTVWGRKLFAGITPDPDIVVHNPRINYFDLEPDYSPSSGAGLGYVYLPEGIFDMAGPGVIKDFRKAEFIAPASRPFATTNTWTIQLETTPGSGTYVPIDGGSVASGVTAERYWTTETSGKRLRARLVNDNTASGIAELEQVIVRGTQRPETTDQYRFVVDARDAVKKFGGVRLPKSGQGTAEALRALVDAGRQATVVWGEESFTGKVVKVARRIEGRGERAMPGHAIEVTIRKVKLS